ncbi:MAG: valine--tRNA ligase [Kiritimatiellaeota bacterium]|nr:valine--tRNA ligase [Kiritimatiellota bacterium]
MDKHYDPKSVEEKWYAWWEANGHFHADVAQGGVPYSVVIPPPNVTGILHMGHALNNTIQDVLVRWRRMQGRNVVWMPGTDHAGIATQNVVEKALKKEGKHRDDLGREAFIARTWEWKKEYGGTIVNQLRKLGASCDWARERFTMDEGLSEAVAEVFCRLYDEGLIYRGHRIINWCPRCKTALSDEESEHVDTQGNLWHIKYPVKAAHGDSVAAHGNPVAAYGNPVAAHGVDAVQFLTVATTRPETMLGDTAVAVNPNDERYASLIGKTLVLPLVNREIPVIADEYIDMAFGTGAVKVTPAHDPNDFEMGQRHSLPSIDVMNDDGTMSAEAGAYAGLDRFEARKRIIADLEAQDLLAKVDPHPHAVGHCYRCDTVVEPRLSKQWFVKMKPLAAPAIEAVRSGKVAFTPKRWENTYFEWMENIRDWCISRQIWWGHRIPVYTCGVCAHEWAAKTAPTSCPKCLEGERPREPLEGKCPAHEDVRPPSPQITQDPDVLDTWFSSWLWPFSTFGWPHDNPDLRFYYPTCDLTTAPDIIFFWVARMIMAGCKFMGDVPFRNVYIHGTVRDDKGRKMSKSLGNSLDPLDIIGQYSADALRFSLMLITSTGMDVYVNMEKFEIGRNFATKIWNAARFMKMHTDKCEGFAPVPIDPALLRDDDRHLLDTLDAAIAAVTEHLEKFRLQDAALAIYDFIWSNFCDWYLEYAKQDLNGTDDARRLQVLSLMTDVFAKSLKLLHPYMPFLTEELWHEMGYAGASHPVAEAAFTPSTATAVIRAPWPAPYTEAQREAWGLHAETTAYVTAKRELVTAGRALRAEYNIAPSKFIAYVIDALDEATATHLRGDAESLKQQLRSDNLEVIIGAGERAMPGTLCKLGTIYLPLDGLIDVAAEAARIKAELAKEQGFLNNVNAKLANESFVAKAPPAVIEQQRARQKELTETIARLEKLHKTFGG